MKESSWDECIETNFSLKITPDKAKSRSLIETAKGRVEFISSSKLNENNANYIFEGYYSSALELLHALILLDGYKVDNHICCGFYLRDVIKRNDLFRIFDDCRFKRSFLVYYGKKMPFEIAKEAVQKCDKLIKNIESLLAKNL